MDRNPLSLTQLLLKRIFDLAVSFLAVMVLSPVLILIAVAVKSTSRGPALFIQERVGKDGKLFNCYKFRTMEINAQDKGLGYDVVKGDERITRPGHLLRKYSLDELPQLFNILKGDMSLVGPRPTLQYQVDAYDDFQKQRLLVKPGLTGLAQIRGRNLLTWEERIKYDVEYLRNYSFWLDMVIILKTFKVILNAQGIYGK